MNRFLKIFFLVLLVLPIWLTIIAIANPNPNFELWKERFNSKLLENKARKIQMTELIARPSDLDALLSDAAFDLDLTSVRDQGISEIAVKFYDKTGRLQKLSRIHAKLFIQDEVPVATRSLTSGDVIQADDFRLEWRDASTFKGSSMRSQDLVGRTVRTSISEHEVIYEARVQRPQLIARGDRVRISVVGSGVTVTGVGIAEESGSRGQTIKILNGDSRKEILGIVTDARAVEVRL